MEEFVDRQTLSPQQSIESGIESAWKEVVAKRVSEIRSGDIEGVPGGEVSARIAKIVGR
jgi:hypothetical protein